MRLTTGDVNAIKDAWRENGWDPSDWLDETDRPDGPKVVMLSIGYVDVWDDRATFHGATVATIDAESGDLLTVAGWDLAV